MHGLTNRAIQCFVRDTYGAATWRDVAAEADLGPHGFEAMLRYDDEVTWRVLALVCERLAKPEDAVLEDLGTYLVSHPNVEALRRLLRFGGVDFVDFLHSLDDLSDRARLAVPDLALPPIEVEADSDERFRLRCRARPGRASATSWWAPCAPWPTTTARSPSSSTGAPSTGAPSTGAPSTGAPSTGAARTAGRRSAWT